MWCYDIQPFSPSDKVLFAFEPGLRLVVGKSDRTGTVPVVDMTFRPYDGFVVQDICPIQMPAAPASSTDDDFASDYVKGLGTFVSNTLSWDCRWDEPSDKLGPSNRYTLDEDNPTIATFTRKRAILGYGVVTGFAPLPQNKVTSWSIKILKSKNNDGHGIYIGVVPYDVDKHMGSNFFNSPGWYLYCYGLNVFQSGTRPEVHRKEYGPRKEKDGKYVHEGDSVGVVMDTTKGELSFTVDSVSLGAAFEGIPLDKPLVPCVHIGWKGDSVELII